MGGTPGGPSERVGEAQRGEGLEPHWGHVRSVDLIPGAGCECKCMHVHACDLYPCMRVRTHMMCVSVSAHMCTWIRKDAFPHAGGDGDGGVQSGGSVGGGWA